MIQSKDVLTDANQVIDTWNANPGFAPEDLTLEELTRLRDALLEAEAVVQARRTGLKGFIVQRNDLARALNQTVMNAKRWIGAKYGLDSAQYKQVGGTRTSERRLRLRRPVAAGEAAAPAADSAATRAAA
jgi:hypothetical protein